MTDTFEQYGVRHLFGNPGATEFPIMSAIADSDLEYVLTLQEDVAVGAAAGYAKTVGLPDDETGIASNDELATAMSAAPDARIVAETPTSASAIRRRYDFDPGQCFANGGGGLGYGLSAAVGSAIEIESAVAAAVEDSGPTVLDVPIEN